MTEYVSEVLNMRKSKKRNEDYFAEAYLIIAWIVINIYIGQKKSDSRSTERYHGKKTGIAGFIHSSKVWIVSLLTASNVLMILPSIIYPQIIIYQLLCMLIHIHFIRKDGYNVNVRAMWGIVFCLIGITIAMY